MPCTHINFLTHLKKLVYVSGQTATTTDSHLQGKEEGERGVRRIRYRC